MNQIIAVLVAYTLIAWGFAYWEEVRKGSITIRGVSSAIFWPVSTFLWFARYGWRRLRQR